MLMLRTSTVRTLCCVMTNNITCSQTRHNHIQQCCQRSKY
jgi:hypothetical protein